MHRLRKEPKFMHMIFWMAARTAFIAALYYDVSGAAGEYGCGAWASWKRALFPKSQLRAIARGRLLEFISAFVFKVTFLLIRPLA